MWEEKTLIIKS